MVGRGRLLIEAHPWGEVTRIVDAKGLEVELPERRTTPLLLELPASSYDLEIHDPGSDEPASCHVEIVAGSTSPCHVELSAVIALDYFKEAGWWR